MAATERSKKYRIAASVINGAWKDEFAKIVLLTSLKVISEVMDGRTAAAATDDDDDD